MSPAPDVIPIIILGAGHSGTTILYRMLALHPDVAWFSQFSERSGHIPGRFRLPAADVVERGLRRVFAHGWQKEEAFLGRYLVPRPGEVQSLWNHMIPEGTSSQDAEAQARIREIFGAHAKRWGKRHVVAKLPRLFNHVELLRLAYPTTRFVHMVRDGRALALSIAANRQRRGESRRQAINVAATYWVEAVRMMRAVSRKDVLEVRYEDYCADVHAHLENLVRFTDLDPLRFPFETVPKTLRVSNDRWLEAASYEDLQQIVKVQQAELASYGYETPLTTPPEQGS